MEVSALFSMGIKGFLDKAVLNPNLDVGIHFAFDGASRGNPGLGSLGLAAWWGWWSDGFFHEGGLILQCGKRLGRATNNAAEAFAVARSVNESLHLLLNLNGELLRQTGRPQRGNRGNLWSRLSNVE